MSNLKERLVDASAKNLKFIDAVRFNTEEAATSVKSREASVIYTITQKKKSIRISIENIQRKSIRNKRVSTELTLC